MFTGIIQTTGRDRRVARRAAPASRLTLAHAAPRCRGLALGESIAVNGACLTVDERARPALHRRRVARDAPPHDARARSPPATRVNLERALRVGDRLGGHIVLGHVDGVGTARVDQARRRLGALSLPRAAARSRPISSRRARSPSTASASPSSRAAARRFTVALIPHTLAETTLGDAAPRRPRQPRGRRAAEAHRGDARRAAAGDQARRPAPAGRYGISVAPRSTVGAELLADAGEQPHHAADEQHVAGGTCTSGLARMTRGISAPKLLRPSPGRRRSGRSAAPSRGTPRRASARLSSRLVARAEAERAEGGRRSPARSPPTIAAGEPRRRPRGSPAGSPWRGRSRAARSARRAGRGCSRGAGRRGRSRAPGSARRRGRSGARASVGRVDARARGAPSTSVTRTPGAYSITSTRARARARGRPPARGRRSAPARWRAHALGVRPPRARSRARAARTSRPRRSGRGSRSSGSSRARMRDQDREVPEVDARRSGRSPGTGS